MAGNDFGRIEGLLERRADLLDASTGLLQRVARAGRGFTDREQDSWNWASAEVDELSEQIGALITSLEKRGYQFPRPGH